MTCDAPLGICRRVLRHGSVDRLAGRRRHGRRHHRRPDRSASRARSSRCVRSTSAASVSTTSKKATSRPRRGGIVQVHAARRSSRTTKASKIVLTRNGEISLVDAKGRELEKYEVPAGAILQGRRERRRSQPARVLCEWDPHSIPILAEVGGKVRFEDVIEGETMRTEKDPSGHIRRMIMEHKGDLHPQVVLEDAERQDSRLLLPARTGSHRSRRRPHDHRRHAARQDAARSVAARRTSPAVCRA